MSSIRIALITIFICLCLQDRGVCAVVNKQPHPIISASAAILIDQTTGKVLYQKHPDLRLPPASTTKIMTGMLLARSLPHPPIKISPLIASVPGDSVKLIPGKSYPAANLLEAMLMVSANDASVAIANSYPGGQPAFVAAMNQLAQRLGANNTHFVNPSGLPANNHYSTARDLAKIAAAAEQIHLFAKIVNTKSALFPEPSGSAPVKMENTDTLLGTLPGLDGVKTGYTDAAGNCFVGDLHFHHHELIVVVLHSQNWQQDTLALFQYGEKLDAAHKQPSSPTASESSSRAHGRKTVLGNPPTTQSDDTGRPQDGTAPTTGSNANGSSPYASSSDPNSDPSQSVQNSEKVITYHHTKSSFKLNRNQNRDKRLIDNLPAFYRSKHSFSLFPLLIWLMLIGLILSIFYFIYRNRKRESRKVTRMSLATLFNRQSRPGVKRADKVADTAKDIAPEFTFTAQAPLRTSGEEWLQKTLEDPSHLLDPVFRRHIAAVFNSDPEGLKPVLDPLLSCEDIMVQVVSTEIMAASSPMEAEESILRLLETEGIALECKNEAVRALNRLTGERHQTVYTRLALDEGSLAAANTLVKYRELSNVTLEALKKCTQKKSKSNSASDLQKHAQLICTVNVILAAHDAEYEKEAERLLQELPPRVKENIVCSLLTGAKSEWAMNRLIDQVLNGSAYPAMQALLNFVPASIKQNLDARQAGMDAGEKTRAQILKWLCAGEGELESIKRLSSAGNETAAGALALASSHRWNVKGKSDGAMVAAAQIISLRLGYSEFSTEQLARTFRRTALQDNENQFHDIPEVLQPLAEANTNPDVYEAVQACLQSEDGMDTLLGAVATAKSSAIQTEELRFWLDKCNPQTRISILNTLTRESLSESNEILEKLARSSDNTTRSMALRALRTQPPSQPSAISDEQTSYSEAA